MELIKSKPYLKEIENSAVYDVAQVTPLSKAETLSKRLKNIVLLSLVIPNDMVVVVLTMR